MNFTIIQTNLTIFNAIGIIHFKSYSKPTKFVRCIAPFANLLRQWQKNKERWHWRKLDCLCVTLGQVKSLSGIFTGNNAMIQTTDKTLSFAYMFVHFIQLTECVHTYLLNNLMWRPFQIDLMLRLSTLLEDHMMTSESGSRRLIRLIF